MNIRWIAWISASIAMIALYFWYGATSIGFDQAGVARCFIAMTAGLVGTAMVFCFPKLSKKHAVILILLTSLLVRLAVLPTAASDDVNRYLWEGKLYAQGVSPYTEVAEHEIYKPHRDHFYEEMNHKDRLTAYPPLSVHIFSFINSISYSEMSYKVVFMIVDMFLIALILATLYQYRRPLHWSLFYALSPIAVLSFTAEGHLDVIMVCFLVLSVFALSKKWFILCGAAMGLAVASKIMVAILAPIILLKTGPKGIIAGAIASILPFALYYQDSMQMFSGLINFGSSDFNGLFHQFFVSIVGISKPIATKLCSGLFVASWCIAFWFAIKNRLWQSIYFSLGALLLFSPILHFWYLTWLLPFVAMRPSLPWISFSTTMPLYFLVWSNFETTGYWELPVWARFMFYAPFVFFSFAFAPQFLLSTFRQFKRKKSIPRIEESLTWSVVIPTLRIDSQVQQVIKDLEAQSTPPAEVIIVSAEPKEDQEITSNTIVLKTTHSEKGRGLQIKTGVEAATCQWCLILHGDNKLAPQSFTQLNSAILANSNIIGGSLGQRFHRSKPGLLLIEAMNEFRATLLHTSFGDQNQFFHRETAINNNILTDQPLMEDVEMSDRLSKYGETMHLAYESVVSAEKWKPNTFWKRFFIIVGFYARYRLFFFSANKRAKLSKGFYKKYYPSEN